MNQRIYPLVFILAAALTGCGRSDKKTVEAATKAPDPITVNVASAQSRTIERSINVTGSLNPDETVTVSPEVQGRVLAIRADFGQTVRQGEVVAELDRTEYQIQLDRTRAALNQALARLGLKPGQENSPPTSTASIRQAQAQLEDAKFKFESAARLVKTGDVSQERFTELEKAYGARQAALDAAQDELRTLWMSMEALKAEVRLAEKRLNDTVIRAPFDGAIMQKHVSPGQFVKENTALLTLVKAYPLRLRVEVPETATWNVKIGTPLTFTTDAAPGIEFHATVRELNPSLDTRNRSLTAEARLQGNDARLRPGMFVQVRLTTERAAQAVMVPKQAVYSIAGLSKVFAIRNGRATEYRIAPGRELDGWIEVPAEQIHAGELVAVSNVPLLVNNSEVRMTGR
jgi:RND family efflux transporter MFP subunit